MKESIKCGYCDSPAEVAALPRYDILTDKVWYQDLCRACANEFQAITVEPEELNDCVKEVREEGRQGGK
jgi:hypothetical protein